MEPIGVVVTGDNLAGLRHLDIKKLRLRYKGDREVELLRDLAQPEKNSTDLHIICSDGYVPVHRCPLMGASSLLRDLLIDKSMFDTCAISVPDITVSEMTQIVQLVYTGETVIPDEESSTMMNKMVMLGLPVGSFMTKKACENDFLRQTPITHVKTVRDSDPIYDGSIRNNDILRHANDVIQDNGDSHERIALRNSTPDYLENVSGTFEDFHENILCGDDQYANFGNTAKIPSPIIYLNRRACPSESDEVKSYSGDNIGRGNHINDSTSEMNLNETIDLGSDSEDDASSSSLLASQNANRKIGINKKSNSRAIMPHKREESMFAEATTLIDLTDDNEVDGPTSQVISPNPGRPDHHSAPLEQNEFIGNSSNYGWRHKEESATAKRTDHDRQNLNNLRRIFHLVKSRGVPSQSSSKICLNSSDKRRQENEPSLQDSPSPPKSSSSKLQETLK